MVSSSSASNRRCDAARSSRRGDARAGAARGWGGGAGCAAGVARSRGAGSGVRDAAIGAGGARSLGSHGRHLAQSGAQLVGVDPGLIRQHLAQAFVLPLQHLAQALVLTLEQLACACVLALERGVEALGEGRQVARVRLLEPRERCGDGLARSLAHDVVEDPDDGCQQHVELRRWTPRARARRRWRGRWLWRCPGREVELELRRRVGGGRMMHGYLRRRGRRNWPGGDRRGRRGWRRSCLDGSGTIPGLKGPREDQPRSWWRRGPRLARRRRRWRWWRRCSRCLCGCGRPSCGRDVAVVSWDTPGRWHLGLRGLLARGSTVLAGGCSRGEQAVAHACADRDQGLDPWALRHGPSAFLRVPRRPSVLRSATTQ